MTSREFDIVLFGATGFVGALTAAHLAEHAPATVRIALAGRSESKLRQVLADLPGAPDWPVVIADSSDPASLRAMAERTRVVITTVGPYAKYGLPLVEACATTGTDYVDLTGEVLFHREAVDRFDAAAEASGARIVPSCGFDSVPSDLAVLFLADAASHAGDGELTETTLYATIKGGASGGTVASAIGQADEMRGSKDKRRIVLDKFALSPDRGAEPSGEYRDGATAAYSDEIRSWTAPFVMASYNTRVVRRSNALLGHRYGRGFRYRELMRTGDGLKGRATAYAVLGGLGAMMGAIAVPFLRPVVDRVAPSPGEGPSAQARAKGYFRMDARSTTTSGARYQSVVAAQGDPGYAATAVMLGEAGLALALQRDELPLPAGRRGGLFTPATALGRPYADRLVAQGFTIEAGKTSA
ncbi:enoyl-ACP reductase [Calidifontibacter sp. DB0510]|uniref:Enoyl-ACP reductase n=1 Tax=Metallococcus carri TaxID=1656884 RepID=A0A967E8L3_9MICO|nr:saccharopine dehydrogenase NADP-binding domain-containing protein [Metallococcus carri]NHN54315.1 enoyl-ACP reductase [Metallococcus carri]NOP36845.1 enoyl-ACP reductase [Calidifontibacter sp. DB2511S]